METIEEPRAAHPAGPALAGTESRRVQVGGVALHVVLAGPAGGRPVMLLHGFPEFWWGWRRQIGPLAAAGLRVIVPDLRGYNLSDKPRGAAAYAIDAVAADVLGLAAALGHARVALVGHDWGAILAWHLAATQPGLVERAAILNGPHPATLLRHVAAHPLQAFRLAYFAGFQVPLLPEAALRANGFALLAAAMRRSAHPGSFTESDLARYREAWAQPGALTGMLNWYRAALRRRPRPAPGRVAVPVRIVWGDLDVALDHRLAERAAALCDEAEVFHLPEATHWVQHDRPEAVNRLLLGFLSG